MATAYGDLNSAAGAADRVFALTADEQVLAAREAGVLPGVGLLRPETVRGELQFDDISFGECAHVQLYVW